MMGLPQDGRDSVSVMLELVIVVCSCNSSKCGNSNDTGNITLTASYTTFGVTTYWRLLSNMETKRCCLDRGAHRGLSACDPVHYRRITRMIFTTPMRRSGLS